MANWKKVLVSGSAIEVLNITASNIPDRTNQSVEFLTIDADGKLLKTGSASGGGGIFVNRGDYYDTENTLLITGSTLLAAPTATNTTAVQNADNIAFRVSQSAHFYNHNVGYPTSNAWKTNLEGSYFNTFDSNTDVSEILRFVAGLLSSSATSPSPNTKIYDSITGVAQSSTNNSDNPKGYVPQNSTNSTITYLEGKGFASDGSTIFSGVSGINVDNIQTNTGFNYKFNSDPGGDTTVSSNAGDTDLFGIGELSDNNGLFAVSASYFWKFENDTSVTINANSSSAFIIDLTSTSYPETEGGVTKNKINTNNPSVIPPQFQDGKFDLTNTAAINFGGGPTLTAKEATGFYEISASIGIKTGSQTDAAYAATAKEFKNRLFYSPVFDGSTIDTNDIGQNSITHEFASSSLTAVSNSLSGAPYLVSATYEVEVTSSGIFDPLYAEVSPIWSVTSDDGKATISTTTQAMSGGNINGTSYVYSSDLSTNRSAGTDPHETDKIKAERTITFSAGASTNVTETGFSSDSGFDIDATAYKRNGTTTVPDSTSFAFFDDGAFGQPLASGTMAYHDPTATNSSDNTNEHFEDEERRVQLNGSNISSTTNLDLGTAANIYDSGSNLIQSNPRALQVKPGFLVTPGGTNKYWHQDASYLVASGYYWYIREFDTNVSVNKNDFTIQFNGISTSDIQDWDATTNDKISLGIIMGSANTKLFDINQSDDDIGIGDTATDTALNPFSNNINIRGNTGRTISGTSDPTYTVKVNDGQGMTLNAANDKFWLVIRYKGDPTPITRITTNL